MNWNFLRRRRPLPNQRRPLTLEALEQRCVPTAGALDPTFDNGGIALTDFSASFTGTRQDEAHSTLIQGDGKIVVVGTAYKLVGSRTVSQFALTRYNTDGSQDTSFGSSGQVTTDIGVVLNTSFTVDHATCAVLQSNGKIVVAGNVVANSQGCGLARYNTDGTLDTTFGGGKGVVSFVFSFTSTQQCNAVALQSDGKIVVAGTAGDPSNQGANTEFAVARFNTDGSQDASFGSGGVVTTKFGTFLDDVANGIAVQSDGKIVAAGSSAGHLGASASAFALARYNPNGTLDAGFGSSGLVSTTLETAPDGGALDCSGYGMALEGNGKIVVCGNTFVNRPGSFGTFIGLALYNTDGSLAHQLTTTITPHGGAFGETSNSVAVQSDGKIVVAGDSTISNSSGDLAVARFDMDLIPDTSFGVPTVNFGSPEGGHANSVAVQSDGKIIAAGFASTTATPYPFDFAVARFTTTGGLDTSFHGNGKLTAQFTSLPQWDSVSRVTLQSDGKIVAVGTTQDFNLNQFTLLAMARYTTTGSLDATFGGGTGQVTTSFGSSSVLTPSDVAVLSDGHILVAGSFVSGSPSHSSFALARYTAAGALDTSFGNNGLVTTSFSSVNEDTGSSMVLQSDGKIVVAGSATIGNQGRFALARYNANGTLDTSFGGTGMVTTDFGFFYHQAQALSIALQSDGKIVAGGYCDTFPSDLGSDHDLALARYNADGSLDHTFGAGTGMVTTDVGTAYDRVSSLQVQSDGKIVAVGPITVASDETAVVRYKADGSLDTSFGSGSGKVMVNVSTPGGLVIQNSGRIVIAGKTIGGGGNAAFGLARLNTDGSLDSSFGNAGLVKTDIGGGGLASSVALQSDGKLVVAGSAFHVTASGTDLLNDFALARYDGSIPTSAPTVAANAPSVTVNVNQPISMSGTFGDSDASATVVITASVGAITQVGTHSGTWSWTLPASATPVPPTTVTITARDNQSASASTSFTYQVAGLPVANDDSYSVSADRVLNTPLPGVLGNDTHSANGGPLTAQLETAPPSAAVQAFTLNADGSFSFTPNPFYRGSTTFTYRARDSIGLSNVATVTITVTDSPTFAGTTSTTGVPVTFQTTAGMTLTSVQAVTPSAAPPTGVTLGYGLFSFQVNGVQPGGAATVTLAVPANQPLPTTYYRYNASLTPSWYEFKYDGTTGAEIDAAHHAIILHFVDGQRGDDDGLPNGTIVDPGGPATTAAQGTPNQRYVARVYQDLLLRSVDPGGLSYWSARLDHGDPRTAIAAELSHSAEYYQTNIIQPAYRQFLNRDADAAGLAYWTGQLQNGLTDEQMQAGFLASDEFYHNSGNTDRLWVDALYQALLGRGPDQGGESYWVGQLQGHLSRSQVANGFTGSQEGLGLRVVQTYERYSKRGASQPEIDYWVGQYHLGGTNEVIVTGFIGSDEYFQQATH